MKVLIVEDELFAQQRLSRLLNEITSGIEILALLSSVESTVNWLDINGAPDLIFMDIQLEDGVSFEIFETIKITTPIIFTTAFDQYAIKAFEVNSVDYLLKPIQTDSLKKAIDKFHSYHQSDNSYINGLKNSLATKVKQRFLIRVGECFKSIQVRDVIYFYSSDRIVCAGLSTGKEYPLDYTLDGLEKVLDSNVFFRINRNSIVNINAIEKIIAYSSNRLKLLIKGWNNDDILVSRERVKDFKNWMDR